MCRDLENPRGLGDPKPQTLYSSSLEDDSGALGIPEAAGTPQASPRNSMIAVLLGIPRASGNLRSHGTSG